MSSQDEDKKLAFETVYDRGAVMIVVAVDDPQLVLPEVARKKASGRHVGLNYSRRFSDANIKLSDSGVTANLSFDLQKWHTFVPWSAIRAIVQKGQVMESWADPEQILVQPTPAGETPDFMMAADEIKWFSTQVAEG
jgi:hypothetical protein